MCACALERRGGVMVCGRGGVVEEGVKGVCDGDGREGFLVA